LHFPITPPGDGPSSGIVCLVKGGGVDRYTYETTLLSAERWNNKFSANRRSLPGSLGEQNQNTRNSLGGCSPPTLKFLGGGVTTKRHHKVIAIFSLPTVGWVPFSIKLGQHIMCSRVPTQAYINRSLMAEFVSSCFLGRFSGQPLCPGCSSRLLPTLSESLQSQWQLFEGICVGVAATKCILTCPGRRAPIDTTPYLLAGLAAGWLLAG